ncbi:release factor [Schizophyllum commune Tattone D]|nr:release factor [Schizophyllum commune Loenen D]KAI5832021.1 release factor [Schizophyllum commune Tattone D]
MHHTLSVDLRNQVVELAKAQEGGTAGDPAALGALLELKPGVGGAEGALFCVDLERMYMRYAAEHGWQLTPVNRSETESGGLREVLMEVRKGKGRGDFESGAHRVQRIPATESSGRVHTSTASVLVLPLVEEGSTPTTTPLFKMEDVRIEVMRARGAGGQHVNKTESAVRLTHIPTGIVVAMQDERSQHVNRRRAFTVLTSRLLAQRLVQEAEDRRKRRNSLVSGVDRSDKIRTYNWPQSRITDHRIGMSVNLEPVMEGHGLETLIRALAADHEERLLEEMEEEVVRAAA